MKMESIEHRGYSLSQANNLCEYFLVALPETELNNKIILEQQYFAGQYQQLISNKSRPHIEVASFMAKEAMETTLIRWMHRIISTQNSFKIMLSNYSGFPPDTLYLRIPAPEAFEQLARGLKALDAYVRSNDCPAIKLNKKPYLAIAKKLTEANYLNAMLDFSQRSFHECLEVKELVLLRRRNAFDSCVPVNKFGLQPQTDC